MQEDPKTLYNAGWSHGKEKLGDKPDTAKGSFYFNPLSDKPGTPELRHQFPLSYPRNVWPDDEKIPGFESKAKNLGSIMHKAVVRLSLHIDALAKKRLGESYADNMLYNQMQGTDKAKGRLLYYFPIESATSDGPASASGSATKTASGVWWGVMVPPLWGPLSHQMTPLRGPLSHQRTPPEGTTVAPYNDKF